MIDRMLEAVIVVQLYVVVVWRREVHMVQLSFFYRVATFTGYVRHAGDW